MSLISPQQIHQKISIDKEQAIFKLWSPSYQLTTILSFNFTFIKNRAIVLQSIYQLQLQSIILFLLSIIRTLLQNNIMTSTQIDSHLCDDSYSSDLDSTSTPKCRICWTAQGDLICPCKCQGSQAYVHQDCLSNQIETARIMRVANSEGVFNSRCPLCKFHIQFKIQEYKCSLTSQDMKEALKNIDEDSVASLSLNLSIIIVLLGILIVTISGHISSYSRENKDLNCKLFILELFLITIKYFLIKNVAARLPRKIRKPVVVTANEENFVDFS